MLLLLALFLSIGIQQSAMAQTNVTVTGKVLDDQGEGIPGVSVQIKGTNSGAITDVDGNFLLKLPEGHDVLVIKSSGFETQQVKVSNPGQALVVRLKPSKSSIGEISVYGQKIDPRTNTGSVSTVTAKDIEKKPITNIVKALDGTAGIQLTSGGGQPGSDPQMMVRGLGSLSANGSPLIVMDGVVYNGDMSSINPSDVASINLLKDATASSLYGARGANGVVLITTKRGQNTEKPQINIEAQTGITNNMLPQMETLDQAGYYKMAFLMLRDYYYTSGQLTKNAAFSDPQKQTYWSAVIGGTGYNNYNVAPNDLLNWVTGDVNPNAKLLYNEPWLPELQRTGFRQVYNVSTSHGNDNSNYYFSLGYNNDQGIVKYTNFERVTSKLSVDANITPWLKTGLDIYGTYTNQRHFVGQTNAYVNPFFTAQMIAPIYPVYLHDDKGNIVNGVDGKPLYDLGINPQYDQTRPMTPGTNIIAALQADDRTETDYNFRGITYLEGKFLKDFTARVDYTLEYFGLNSNTYQNMIFGDGAPTAGRVNQGNASITDYTFRQRIVWNPSFGPFASGDHSLAVTIGHENTLTDNHSISFARTGFTDPIFREGAAAAVNESSYSAISQLAMESYLAIASYDYHKKYFLKASFRRDGSSRFSSTARWGNFWSVGGGWMISQENFMNQYSNWLSELKVRISYGIQGNEDLGSGLYYAWLPNYVFSSNASAPGYIFGTWGNPNLHWEGNYMFNPGIDLGFLNGRITANIDYYRRGSSDLLYVRPFAPSTGIGGMYDNVGSTQNTGVELTLAADVIRTRDFTWNAKLNLSHNRMIVTKMQRSDSDAIYGAGVIMKKGLAVGTWFMPKYAGVDPKNGDELYYLADGSTTNDYTIASQPVNERIMGEPWRDLEGAFINTLTYKNISLSFQLNFGLGGKFYDNNYAQLMQPANAFSGQNWSPDILNSWTPENPNASLPRVGIGEANIGKISDRFLMSASFLKIQNINLSYQLPDRWMKAAHFNSASIFVAADNVYLLTARKGVDVEASFFGTNSLSYYPYRTVMFGVRLGL